MTSDFIIEKLKLNRETVLNIYMYGSRVYGSNTNKSDYDFIVVVEDGEEYNQIQIDNIEASIYNLETFESLLDMHEISVLECLFLPSNLILQEKIKFNITLDKNKLRETISKKSSNSYVKCKKKLTVIEDFNEYVAKKSLFHSLRILMFGIQISSYGKIVDYQQCNYLYTEIINAPNSWEYLNNKYKPLFNSLKTEFRKLTPKQ